MAERLRRALAGAVLASVATAALAAPPPPVPVPAAWADTGQWVAVTAVPPAPNARWWSAFHDPVLDALEARIEASNPSYAAALARVEAARGFLRQRSADLFPQLGAGAVLSENRQSDARPLRGGNQPDEYGNQAVVGALGYEVDLWGRARSSVAAGRAAVAASADDAAAIRLGLQAQLAADFIELRGYDRQIALLDTTVSDFASARDLVQRRFEGGIASGLDAARAESQLADAQSQLAQLQAARALTEHAIASLVGAPAAGFHVAPVLQALPVPLVPMGLPSTLLQARPDVAAAEQRVLAANATIGAARAAFFPSLTLGGSLGTQSAALAGLFAAGNFVWSLGPALALSIFDGGKRRGQLQVARADWAAAVADYRRTVLAAIQDVEDSLGLLHRLGDASAAQSRAAAAAHTAEALSLDRYRKGAVTYLEVATAQTAALHAEAQQIALDTRRAQASVRLFRALGGGWQG